MDVEIVSSVRYGNYKEFLERARVFEMLIQKSELRVRTHINLPEQIKITLRPIRSVFGTASTFKVKTKSFYTVEIDVRQSVEEFCDTLLHELVHIEQYFEGRLKLRSELFYSIYEGRRVRLISNKFDEYNDLPWEKEAYAKQNKKIK